MRNRLLAGSNGQLLAEPTDVVTDIPAGLVLRSVGYRGCVVAGLPFDADKGIVPNALGRVVDPQTANPLPGVYVTGWIKRGPSGVIGTNKGCARQTVECLLQDAANGCLSNPRASAAEGDALLSIRQPDRIDYLDWKAIDRHERIGGVATKRPRVKLTRISDMLRLTRTTTNCS